MDYLYCSRNSVPEVLELFKIALQFTNLEELPNVFVIKTVLLFMSHFSTEYKHNLELSLGALQYCFRFMKNQELQLLASDVFYLISSSLQLPLSVETFDDIIKEVFLVLEGITCTSTVEHLIMGIFNLTKKFSDRESSLACKNKCFDLVQIKLQQFIEGVSTSKTTNSSLFAIIKLLTACFSSLDIAREPNDVQVMVGTRILFR